ncbi:MAG: penicillin-binding protein [Propionibacteriaceae bacterium]|jgi:membrane peptidoglycan carboxypeptidase|nr:penicillin-binding protein [Propionibacteriaceae bacterium]
MANKSGTPLQRLTGFVVFSLLAGLLTAGMVVPAVVLATGLANATAEDLLQLPTKLEVPPPLQATEVLASDGSPVAVLAQDTWEYVTLDHIAPVMQQAILAIEDHRFYDHGAIDLPGFARALVTNVFGGDVQGASSITQQYVKLVRMQIAQSDGDTDALNAAQEATLSRKIAEMRYAIAMEQTYTKAQILEKYLNIAYFGDGAYGVEAAAYHFFGTTAAELTLPQAAMIAGLVQNPSTTDPVNHEDRAVARRNVVLTRMADPAVGAITVEAARAAMSVGFDQSKTQPFNVGCANSKYPFVCDYLERAVQRMPEFGSDPASRLRMLRTGGFTITLTIEPEAMDAALAAVSERAGAIDPVIAVTASVEPGTGKILSMAQSRPVMGLNVEEGETYYNYAVDAPMGGAEGFQAGSTFKVFTLATALSQGASLGHYYDSPRSLAVNGPFESCTDVFTTRWQVGNFAGENNGWITLLQATVGSVNTYFAQLIRDVGVCNTVKMARAAGLHSAENNPNTHGNDLIEDWHYDVVPSFTLGAAYVSPLTMAETFATFAARGVHCDAIIIQDIKRSDGTTMTPPSANCAETVNPEVADGVSWVMNQVMYGGGAASGRVYGPWQQAGKTGTTDSAAAYWMVGFTRSAATTVAVSSDNNSDFWNDRGSKSIQGLWLPSGRQIPWDSGGTAGPIWRAVMTALLNAPGRETPDFDPYSPISGSFRNLLTPTPSTVSPTPTPEVGGPGGPAGPGGTTTTTTTSSTPSTTPTPSGPTPPVTPGESTPVTPSTPSTPSSSESVTPTTTAP